MGQGKVRGYDFTCYSFVCGFDEACCYGNCWLNVTFCFVGVFID